MSGARRSRHHDVMPEVRKDIEVGHYVVGDAVVVYVNHAGVCVFRERVPLPRNLGEVGRGERLAVLRRLWSRPALPEGVPCSG